MKIIFVTIAAALLAAGSAWSADNLADKEAAELRQRAQEFQNERSRNPDFQPGEGRSAPEPEQATHKRPKKHAAKPAAPVKKTQAKEPMKEKAARSIKNIPGALLRK
jgi:hypothetical protein